MALPSSTLFPMILKKEKEKKNISIKPNDIKTSYYQFFLLIDIKSLDLIEAQNNSSSFLYDASFITLIEIVVVHHRQNQSTTLQKASYRGIMNV